MIQKQDYLFVVWDDDRMYAINSLSQEGYDWLVKQILELDQISFIQDLFEIVKMNHQELKRKIESLTSLCEKAESTFESYKLNMLEVNRIILNTLSSIKMFLDHTQTRLSHILDQQHKELDNFKKLTHNAYDSSFAYRFLDQFRNYTQHCGMAPDSLNILHSFVENGKVKCVIQIFLYRDKLLPSFDWKKIIREDLKNKSEKIDFIELIDEKINILDKINVSVTKDLYSNHLAVGREISTLLMPVKNLSGAPCIVKNKTGGLLVNYIPFDLIKKIPGVTLDLPLRKSPPDTSKQRNIYPDLRYYEGCVTLKMPPK